MLWRLAEGLRFFFSPEINKCRPRTKSLSDKGIHSIFIIGIVVIVMHVLSVLSVIKDISKLAIQGVIYSI